MSVLVADVASLLGAAVAEALLRRGTPVLGQALPRLGVDPHLVQGRLARLAPLPGFANVDEATLPEDVSAIVQIVEPLGHRTRMQAALRLERMLAALRLENALVRLNLGLQRQPMALHLVQVAHAATPEEILGYGFARRYGLPVTSFRTTALYAAEDEPDQLCQRLADALMAGRPLLLPAAPAVMMPLWLDDAVAAVLAALDRPPTSIPPFRRLYLAGPDAVSPRQLAELLAQALGVEIAGELPLAEGSEILPDAERLANTCRTLGWHPTVDVADGVARFAAWHRSRR